jgi:hypothetical protein
MVLLNFLFLQKCYEFFVVVVAVSEEDAEFVKFLFRKTEATIHAIVDFSGIKVFDVWGGAFEALSWSHNLEFTD